MKMQVNITKNKLFISVFVILLIFGVMFAYAYSSSGTGGTPSVFGHSIDEIDWTKVIPFIFAKNINVSQTNTTTLCLSGDCKNVWPSTGTTDFSCTTSGAGNNCFIGCPVGSSAIDISGCPTANPIGTGYTCYGAGSTSCTCTITCSPKSPIALPLNCPAGQFLTGISASGTAICASESTTNTICGGNYQSGITTITYWGCAQNTGSAADNYVRCNAPATRKFSTGWGTGTNTNLNTQLVLCIV